MENVQKSIQVQTGVVNKINTNIRAGIFTTIGLIFYFVIMWFFNLHHYLELHYLNIFVLFFGIRYAIKSIISYKGEIKYFEGIKSGLTVTIFSIVVFNIFMVVYETIIDPSFLIFLQENISLGNLFSTQETVFNVAGLLTVEGLSSGFILTYMLMQYYKADSSETK